MSASPMPVPAKQAFERDPVTLDPGHYKVELENDRVRVVRIRYDGKEKSVMHQHPPGVCAFLTDVNCRFTFPDGRVEALEGKAGQFLYFGETTEHDPENLSDQPLEAIYIELK
jgi:uncharacterized RmlC-like cupin family protein